MNQSSRPILPPYNHGERLLQQKPLFTQNNNKARGTSSHFWLRIQADESLWGNFGSRGLEGQEVYLVKLQGTKVDKRNIYLACLL